MLVSALLREKMKACGIANLATLSRLTGVHPNTLGSLLNHDAGLKEQTAKKFADAGFGGLEDWMACEVYRKANPSKKFLAYAKKVRVRATSRRKFALKPCFRCGTTLDVERHHKSYESLEVLFMCRACHSASHNADGTWERGGRREARCIVCGDQFQYKQKKANKTCSKECLSERCKQLMTEKWRKGLL